MTIILKKLEIIIVKEYRQQKKANNKINNLFLWLGNCTSN